MSVVPPQLTSELATSEKVVWFGQPRQGIVLRSMDALLIPFSLLWGGFAIFWEISTFVIGAPVFFSLFGLIFVVIGIYLIVGRFFVDAKQRTQTFYAVTNDRVIIVSGLFSRTVKSIDLKTLGEMSLSERRDGRGSIVFGSASPFEWLQGGMPGWPGMGTRQASRFELIENARKVYELIRLGQKSST
jgi:hypothetical protein